MPSSGTPIIISVILAACLLAIVVYVLLKHRIPQTSSSSDLSWHTNHHVGQAHPAHRIIPYLNAHEPGSNMRVAHRRSDGGWIFGEPITPTTPTSSLDVELTPYSSRKEREVKMQRSLVVWEPPPPAYVREPKHAA